MKTVSFVILDKFADWEGAYLASALNMLAPSEFAIKTVSLTKAPVTSIGGFTALPDRDLASAPRDAVAVILVGGLSWRTEAAKAVGPFAARAKADGVLLGGICDAAAFLGTQGLLNDVVHTANELADLKTWAGAAYTGENKFVPRQAVRGSNVVTANGTAPLEFAKEVLYALNAAPTEMIDEWYEFHKLGLYTAPLAAMKERK